jgi:hypothetical protein
MLGKCQIDARQIGDDKFSRLVMNYHFRSVSLNLFKGNGLLKGFNTVGSDSAKEKESIALFFRILHNLFGCLAKIFRYTSLNGNFWANGSLNPTEIWWTSVRVLLSIPMTSGDPA